VDIVMLTQTHILDRSIAEIVEFSSSVEGTVWSRHD